jgi:polyhydroxyalkanoate synthesis regulator protein
MQMLVPRFLEASIESLTREQGKFRDQMTQAFGVAKLGTMEEQVRRNMEMFQRTFAMFAPFARREAQTAAEAASERPPGEIDELKRQLNDMQKRLDRLSDKDKPSGSPGGG